MYSDEVEEIVEHVTRSDHGGNVFLVLSNGAFGGLFARLKEEVGARLERTFSGPGHSKGKDPIPQGPEVL